MLTLIDAVGATPRKLSGISTAQVLAIWKVARSPSAPADGAIG